MSKGIGLFLVFALLSAPSPAGAFEINKEGGATISVKLKQHPPAGPLSSRYLGTDPGKCLAAIPFEGTMTTGVAQDISYWFIHSDGTKSATFTMPPPTQAGKTFTYSWYKYLPPNQSFSGNVRAEATWANHKYIYKSPVVPFTVTCIPVKPSSWPSAPIIGTPAENQKVAGGNIIIQPMNPGSSKCADGGLFLLQMEHRASTAAPWTRGGLMKPLPCVPAGSKKPLKGMAPGLYRVRAHESNGKYGFTSELSGWRQFEIVP